MNIDHPLPGDIAALRLLWKEAFGDTDAYLDIFFAAAFRCDHCLCIKLDDGIAAAAYWMDCQIGQQTAAYIYAVATTENRRGRGFCRALMDSIHAILRHRDYCGSILVPGDDELRRMYGTMGYKNFGGIREFTCEASNPAANIRKISKTEYACLRRQFLPENGVIQEDVNLEFLGELAHFYAGQNCLLAVSREQGLILELLGDVEAAPGILKAMDVEQARVRTIGETPFAMYRPLNGGISPTYFAFAFD